MWLSHSMHGPTPFPTYENQAFNLTPASAARRLKNLQNQAQALNMKLVPA